MPPDAALLILSVATAFAYISAESTCRNEVHCSCGSTGETFIVCAEQNATSADPCTRWPECKSCKGGSEDSSCFTARNRNLRSRQKRQYSTDTRRPTTPAKRKTCGDPGFLVRGFRRLSNGTESKIRRSFQKGESLVFGCKSNEYDLQGPSSITCRDGEWSAMAPKCIKRSAAIVVTEKPKTTCGDPGFIDNGYRMESSSGAESTSRRSFQEGESLVFSCISNEYAMQGSSNMVCKNGKWTQKLPTCIERVVSVAPVTPKPKPKPKVTCGDPGFLANGFRRLSNGTEAKSRRSFQEGESLVLSCRSNKYVLEGSSNIICRYGEWSEAMPKCNERTASPSEGRVLAYCSDPGRATNGHRVPVDAPSQRGFSQGTSIEYSCNQGFELEGEGNIICLASGRWSSAVPKCEVQEGEEEICMSVGDLENGNITYFPRNSQRAADVNLDDFEFPPNSRLVFSCNEGYRRQGASEITCQSDGTWSPDAPTCALDWTLMYCENPGLFIHGRVEYFPPATFPMPIPLKDGEYPEGTRAQYTCAEGFDLQGTANVSCLPTSHWSSAQPVCFTECGLSFASVGSKVFNGTTSSAGEWPWVVSIRQDSDSDISCGGAVLNGRTVITAAHCLPNTSKSYILYFGKIRKMDKDDDAKVMKRTSSKIILSRFYSAKTMENDIALIHFSNSIQFTDRIHPICLPDTFSTFKNIQPGIKGYVSGFGENEFSLTPDNLKSAHLPVQENEVCEDYFREKGISMNMTLNMFCAGHPNAVQATCKGDSGSAFVFKNGSTNHYTLEGLVSASTNGQCGVYGKYTVFTKVLPYVPWILKFLAI